VRTFPTLLQENVRGAWRRCMDADRRSDRRKKSANRSAALDVPPAVVRVWQAAHAWQRRHRLLIGSRSTSVDQPYAMQRADPPPRPSVHPLTVDRRRQLDYLSTQIGDSVSSGSAESAPPQHRPAARPFFRLPPDRVWPPSPRRVCFMVGRPRHLSTKQNGDLRRICSLTHIDRDPPADRAARRR